MRPPQIFSDKPLAHTTAEPGLVVIGVDESRSMADPAEPGGASKASLIAEGINTLLRDVYLASHRGEALQDRCMVGVYSFSGLPSATTVLRPHEVGWPRQWDEEAYGHWVNFEPRGSTPLAEALDETTDQLNTLFANDEVVRRFVDSMPPIVLVCTDGGSDDLTGGDRDGRATRRAAERLWSLRTPCGRPPLIFTTLIATAGYAGPVVRFPTSPDGLNPVGRLLYDISSYLPTPLIRIGRGAFDELQIDAPHVGMIANGKPGEFIRLMRIGTVPTGLISTGPVLGR